MQLMHEYINILQWHDIFKDNVPVITYILVPILILYLRYMLHILEYDENILDNMRS